MAPDPDESNILDKNTTKRIHFIVGTMLYYARSGHPTILREIDEIPRVKSRPTQYTGEKARMLLDYAATYPNEIIRCKASVVVLHVHSDGAYLFILEARSCYAGRLYVSDWPSLSLIKPNPERNGPIHTKCKTIRNIVSYAAEDETYGIFKNGKTAIGMQLFLI